MGSQTEKLCSEGPCAWSPPGVAVFYLGNVALYGTAKEHPHQQRCSVGVSPTHILGSLCHAPWAQNSGGTTMCGGSARLHLSRQGHWQPQEPLLQPEPTGFKHRKRLSWPRDPTYPSYLRQVPVPANHSAEMVPPKEKERDLLCARPRVPSPLGLPLLISSWRQSFKTRNDTGWVNFVQHFCCSGKRKIHMHVCTLEADLCNFVNSTYEFNAVAFAFKTGIAQW